MAVAASRDLTLNLHERRDGNALVAAARDLEQLARGADVAGDKLAGLSTDLEKVDAQIASTRVRIRDLSAQIARTGDMSLFGDLRKEEADLRRLQRVAKNIAEEIAEAAEKAGEGITPDMEVAGKKAGAGFLSGFGVALSGVRPTGPLIAILVGAAVAAAPTVGAVIGGALAGAVGTIGVAGGVAMAAKSPLVKTAARDLGDTVMAELERGGQAFIAPTVRSLDILREAVRDMDVAETFAKMAPHVATIAQGFAEFGRNLMPGLNTAFERMGPLADTAAEGIAATGDAFSDFLDDITASEGTREGLQVFFNIVSGLIRGTGNALRWLSDRFDEFTDYMEAFSLTGVALSRLPGPVGDAFKPLAGIFAESAEGMRSINDGIDKFSNSSSTTSRALEDLAAGGAMTAEQWKDLNDEFERSIDLQTRLKLDTLDFKDSLAELDEVVAKNGTTLSDNTEQGRENQRTLIGIAEEARRLRDDMIAMGDETADANLVLEQNKQKFIEQAVAAGFSREEVEKLTAALFSVPPLTTAQILVERVERNLSTGEHSGVGDSRDRRAAGGPVTSGVSYLVGERRAEVFTPSRSGYMYPSVGAYQNAMGGGGQTSVLVEIRSGGSELDDLLVRILSRAIQIRGGDGAVLGIRTVSG